MAETGELRPRRWLHPEGRVWSAMPLRRRRNLRAYRLLSTVPRNRIELGEAARLRVKVHASRGYERVERGVRNPTITIVAALAKALGVPSAELLA